MIRHKLIHLKDRINASPLIGQSGWVGVKETRMARYISIKNFILSVKFGVLCNSEDSYVEMRRGEDN